MSTQTNTPTTPTTPTTRTSARKDERGSLTVDVLLGAFIGSIVLSSLVGFLMAAHGHMEKTSTTTREHSARVESANRIASRIDSSSRILEVEDDRLVLERVLSPTEARRTHYWVQAEGTLVTADYSVTPGAEYVSGTQVAPEKKLARGLNPDAETFTGRAADGAESWDASTISVEVAFVAEGQTTPSLRTSGTLMQ